MVASEWRHGGGQRGLEKKEGVMGITMLTSTVITRAWMASGEGKGGDACGAYDEGVLWQCFDDEEGSSG